MLWIKRNLFLAIGGLIALGLLGFGGYYFWTNYQENNAVEEKLKQAQEDLKHLYALVPFPSPENITKARAEVQRLQTAIKLTQKSFTPLPYQRVKGQTFKTLLDTTIDDLQKQAEQAGIGLPQTNRYAFTFAEQQKRLQFTEGSFPTLAEQLAEIKAICTILFDAKINKLTSLRRGRVTTDDIPTAADYHEMCPNRTLPSGAVVSAYVAEFNSFSSELAAVLEGFYKSPNGLLVKSVEARPLDEKEVPAGQPIAPVPNVGTNAFRRPVSSTPITTKSTSKVLGGGTAGEGFKTVLDEKMLKITLWVDVLKPPVK